ncbi:MULTISPECIES: hypothetical protein [Arthrobacter]|uniref:Uncharacterized protein n=1 Tax=Arthrobacter psychrochitiniphilus TaxID=291045 RepID=A0A2V3DSM0_9MICC|nr:MULTISPECIES: hypothetical protein [Arthrobacter]NYG18880.1 hypothetical protein [Arthrobacter psychrochitiniphilus]PXA66216.1 hypothetical protein CVS29_05800 [Arthrobacter psychrochitiniphilus]
MTSSPAAAPLPDQSAIAAQEAPLVNGRVFMVAGLGALLSALLLLLGSGDPATISAPVFFLTPMIPAICAVLLWLSLKFTPKTEARRQTTAAAGALAIVGVVFFFVEFSVRFELSLYFALMFLAWGVRLKFAPLSWAALPYLAAAIVLRVLDFPGEALVLAVLGALTIAWAFFTGRRKAAAVTAP